MLKEKASVALAIPALLLLLRTEVVGWFAVFLIAVLFVGKLVLEASR